LGSGEQHYFQAKMAARFIPLGMFKVYLVKISGYCKQDYSLFIKKRVLPLKGSTLSAL